MMERYRFYKFIGGTYKVYLEDTMDYTDHQHAGLFTEQDWQEWAEADGLEREEIGEDEAMRLVDAPRLPGMED